MNVGLYARVSTSDQDCSMQIDELRRYCKARGWDVSQEYIDAISGAKSSRPERDQLMRDAIARRIDVVIVWKLDRWGEVWLTALSLSSGLARPAFDSFARR